MFTKLVAIEPVGLLPYAEEKLQDYAHEVVIFDSIPSTSEEIVSRIGSADAILVNYTSTIDQSILAQCPKLKYIGMCCSLYTPESANVDIHYANSVGITVKGIRDYGDEGVVEYALSELIRCLHGFGIDKQGRAIEPWFGESREITGLKVGIVGLGKSGGMIADALHFLGADISYFARSEKEKAQAKGYTFLPLKDVLQSSEVVFTCLNKNTVLLYKEEFTQLGEGKILFNTGLSPSWEENAFTAWVSKKNRFYCDSFEALGNNDLLDHPHIYCMGVSSGRTQQAYQRLSDKVLANLSEYHRRHNIA